MPSIASPAGDRSRVPSSKFVPRLVPMETLGPGPPHPKIRVLVADDEEVIAHTLATILNLAGYEVCAVYDGETAVKLLNLFKPNLIITDVTMPGTTGVEIAFAAQSTLPRCKILLFNGQTALHQLLGDPAAGDLPFEVITKPIHPADLLALLKKLLSSEKPVLLVPLEMDDQNVH